MGWRRRGWITLAFAELSGKRRVEKAADFRPLNASKDVQGFSLGPFPGLKPFHIGAKFRGLTAPAFSCCHTGNPSKLAICSLYFNTSTPRQKAM